MLLLSKSINPLIVHSFAHHFSSWMSLCLCLYHQFAICNFNLFLLVAGFNFSLSFSLTGLEIFNCKLLFACLVFSDGLILKNLLVSNKSMASSHRTHKNKHKRRRTEFEIFASSFGINQE